MEERSAFIALQSFLNRLRSPTVRMILEKVKENGFLFLRSHATLNYYTEKLLFDLHTFEKVSRGGVASPHLEKTLAYIQELQERSGISHLLTLHTKGSKPNPALPRWFNQPGHAHTR